MSEIGGVFRATCHARAADVAVIDLSRNACATFGELQDHAALVGRALHRLGVDRDACVVLRLGNTPAFFSAFVAVLDAGATVLPLGACTDAEASALAAEAGAAAVVTGGDAVTMPVNGSLPWNISIRAIDRTDSPRRLRGPAVLKLTSGSTSLPKAAEALERHLINDGRHLIDAMGIRANDLNLGYIPLSHSYALGNIVMPLILQGTPVALRQVFNPSQFESDVAACGATVFPGVPFMFEHLAMLPNLDRLPAHLRLLVTAGARVKPATVAWCKAALDRKLHSFYGSSETGGITYDDSDDVADTLHVGHPLPETTVEILTGDADLEGRVFVRGTAVTMGYAAQPTTDDVADRPGDPAASTFRDDGFLTGDHGEFDPAGRLVLAGRSSAMVNVAGRKVDPSEVERVLVELPGVLEARVIGVASESRGQELAAFLVSSVPLTHVRLRQHCAATLSPHKIPRRFVCLDRLPVDERGKTDRRALEALARGGSPS